jgi:hypothetical protein
LTRVLAHPTFDTRSEGWFVMKPGVTQELRARVRENFAAEARRRRLMTVTVAVAIVAVCAYVLVRWVV